MCVVGLRSDPQTATISVLALILHYINHPLAASLAKANHTQLSHFGPCDQVVEMSFTTEAFTLLGIGIAFIVLRWMVRINAVGLRGLQADDFLMVLVVVRPLEAGSRFHSRVVNNLKPSSRTVLRRYKVTTSVLSPTD